MKKFLFLCLFLCGCSNSSSPEVVAGNRYELKQAGFYIGEFADGGKLYRWEISNGTENYPHYVYRIIHSDGVEPAVSVNHTSGKANRAIVVIDGKEYVPKAD